MTEPQWSMPWLEAAPADFRPRIKALPAEADAALLALQALARADLDLDQLNLLSRALNRRADALAGMEPASRLRLTVLGDYTTHYLADVLPAVALRHGLAMEVTETPYDQLAQQVFGEDTVLKTSAPDAVFLALDHRQLGLAGALADAADAEARADGVVTLLASLAGAIGRDLGVPVILHTLPQTPASLTGGHDAIFPGSLRAQIARVNQGVRELCLQSGRCLLDLEALAAEVGLSSWHDARLWQAAKAPYALNAIPLVAERLCRLTAALRGKSRKCLVLDLDNTLWGGVVGDDGLEGIQMSEGSATGEAFRAVQAYALEQRARGVILAVCSKNEHDVALRAFREHPEMLIREADVAAFQVNWDDKATNLRRIAEALNIGVDSLVFVDDNPAERHRVRQMLPMVAIPELPEDPAGYVGVLWAASYFEALSLSGDDLKRADAYQANAARASELAKLGDMEAYLGSLEMTCTLAPFDAVGRTRIAQLINKSNQYNLTTRRYTEAEVAAVEADPRRFHLQVRLTDRFGDNGMISVAIFDKRGDVWACDTWLMSCRVLGRRVEEAVLREVAAAAQAEGATALTGDYIPSAKNAMVAGHFGKLGFVKAAEAPDGRTAWRLDLADYAPPELPMRIRALSDPLAA